MNALQYSYTLPPDFDMQIVRDRVMSRKHLLAGLAGLRWKAWLISEPLPGRPQAKSYAPVYFFEDGPSTLSFLAGPLYKGVTDAFGWTLPFQGPALGGKLTNLSTARFCTLRVSVLSSHDELLAAVCGPDSAQPNALGSYRMLDVARMELRTYSFWTMLPEALSALPDDICYEVVSMSAGRAAG